MLGKVILCIYAAEQLPSFYLHQLCELRDKGDAKSQRTHPVVLQPWHDLQCNGRYSTEDDQESNSWLVS